MSKRRGRKAGGGARKAARLGHMEPTEAAGETLEKFRRMGGEAAPHSYPGDPEGAMAGIEKFDSTSAAAAGASRHPCRGPCPRPAATSSRGAPAACSCSMLLQGLWPRMGVRRGCGKVRYPRLGSGHGAIMDAVLESRRGE